MRKADINRKTNEVDIKGVLNIDGEGKSQIKTGFEPLNHLLALFSFHGLFDLTLDASGDLAHHIIEDIGIALGKAFKALLANPVVLVVGAIVAGLTALYKAFTRTEEGSNKMAIAFAYLEGLMIPLIKGAEELAKGFYNLFTEPQKAIEDFGKSLQKWVIWLAARGLEIVPE